ncbi:hypothetical protein [Blastochloris sulfoviridis]|uniref:hypothetical protein n=1 Tax=Blastochloris sulfoviridis TaxID=50712 RepID=UPI001B7D839F|nr:hypothetical protein [Blastochloris sulfoviridis]
MMSVDLASCLAAIPDPRRAEGKMYGQVGVIPFSIIAMRQSFDAFHDRKAAHVLSAFAVDHQIILAHEVVEEKSNEIPAVQTLIETLGLTGRVFTLNAMHCQKNIRGCPRHRQ